MLRGIVFDMDGVVIDSHPIHRRAWKSFLKTVARSVTDEELDFILDGRRRDEILRYFLGELSPSQIADHGAHKDGMLRQLGEDMQPLAGSLSSWILSLKSGCESGSQHLRAAAAHMARSGSWAWRVILRQS